MRVEVTYRTRPKVGERESGDAVLVRQAPDQTLVAVIDALGHGPVAAAVATRAVAALEQVQLAAGIASALEATHEALKGTRGAALTLGLFDRSGAEFCGVGNVQLRGLSRSMPFGPAPGVVGGRMGRPRSSRIDTRAGDKLLFYSDGIPRRTRFDQLAPLAPDALLDGLLLQAHDHDDATVLLVRLEPLSSPSKGAGWRA